MSALALQTVGPEDVGAAVLDRARQGDEEAFATIVQVYDRRLRGLAYRVLGDPNRMDDALQEAYVRAFRALPRFRGDARLSTWLFRITYNACLDELARANKVSYLPLDELATALAALAPEERAALVLVDAEGFDYSAAAKILGIPVGTVASRLNRARSSLRGALRGPAHAARQLSIVS